MVTLDPALRRRGPAPSGGLRAHIASCYLGQSQQGQLRCMTRSPTAKSAAVVIVETFESHSTDRNPSRLSLPALVAAACVQSTERPGPRIQMAGFICGSPMNRG